MFQQFVGINVIFYYGATLWQAAGFSESHALFTNVITGVTNIASTLLAIALIDKIGRRRLLLIGSAGMGISLAVQTAAFIFGAVHGSKGAPLGHHASFIALVAANLYIGSFGVSWGPVVWVMLGEMFGNQFRGAALSVSAAVQWLANFLVIVSFPSLLEHAGPGGSYACYTVVSILSYFFVLKFIRETRGKTLEAAG